MTGVSLRVTGDKEAIAAFSEASRRAGEAKPVWEEIGQMLITSSQERFATGEGPDGNPWPPSIRALTTGGRTMVDSALLRNSITKEVSDNGVAVGTDLIKAAILQFGGVITAKTDAGLMFKIGDHFVRKQSVSIPARPFLGINKADEDEIAIAWEEWLGAPLGGAHA